MKHARPDYDRIQDPAGIIPEDEPVFLLRGQDKTAAALVKLYVAMLEMNSGDKTLIKMAKAHVKAMEAWPTKKLPDITKDQAAS